MSYTFKQFNIDNSVFLFCVEDFEIFKISQCMNLEIMLKEIINKKEASKPDIVNPTNVNMDYDYARSSAIYAVGIELANGCNLSCSYCYISASKKTTRNLSKDLFTDILRFLIKLNVAPKVFYFTGGGEPTLNFNLLKQLPFLCREYGFDNCAFDLTTNGTILTNEMIDFYKKNRFIINISLDGGEQINNTARVFSNGKGSFIDVFNNINLLRDNEIMFSCKTVIQPASRNLVEVFSFFEENKIRCKFDLVVSSFDNCFVTRIDDLDSFNDQWEDVIEYYRELIENNKKVYVNKIVNDIKRIHYGIISRTACGASRDGFFIDIDGKIFPCSAHSADGLSVGDIYSMIDHEKILNNKWYAQTVDNYPMCNSCWMKYLCSGSCFAQKWLENGNTEEPSEYLCRGFEIYWKAIIKLYIRIYKVIINGKNLNFAENEN